MATQRMSLREFFAYQRNEMVTYRITPHSNVTNNQNAKMWRVLHKMYEIYDRMPTRLTCEGFRFTLREKDTIWIDVVFRQVAGVKSVEYYVSTSQIWAKKFREIVENFMHVTVEVADQSALVVPAENEVTLNELRLARHDIFALQTNAAEQTSPVASILTALDDIAEDGDYARLSVCSETLDRRKWSQNASYAHEKLTKGKVPQRAKLTADKAYKTLGKALATMLNEIYDIVNDTLHAISNVFFKSTGGFEKRKAIDKPDALIEEIQANKLSAKSADKINQAVWKSHVRVVASTKEILRCQLVANTISSAFGELAGNNELVPFKVRMKARKQEILDELNTLHLSARTRADGDVSLLSCDELAKVALQMPTAIVQQRYEEELATNRRVETDLPKVMLHKPAQKYVEIEGIRISIGECNITRKGANLPVNCRKTNGILVGHSEVRGVQYPIGLPTNNLDETFRSYGLVGAPRMGKDTLAKNIVIEGALQHGMASFVIDAIMEDGERGFADGVRDSLPPDRIIDIDLSDAEYPVPMDLTEIVEQLGANGANRFAQELIDFFGDMESMGQSRAILREFAKASGGSLFAIKRLLEDEGYRAEKARELRQQGNVRTADFIAKYTSEWGVDAKGNPKLIRDGQKALDGKASAILNRLDEMLGDDVLFRIFAQPASADIDFAKWIREGKVVILRVPNRKLGALSAKTLIHWITLKIFMTKLLMDPSDGGAFIVFNEPHQFLTPGLKALMQRIVLEGPKWRLAGIFAFHHFDLLRYGLDDDLISGGINWFLFANDNRKVFERLEAQLKPTFDVDLALRTEAYDAIVLARFGGRRQNAFLMRALPPASQRVQQYDNSFLTKRHSRMYGRHWQTVEQLLASGEV
ncbi:ATP-binding protein [Niallia sp. FSL M8-0099]|uniref:ATP-binding protein n=1 Tax=Niallia sp. FSL M8-0099 TaxID=2954519 RepID=UPI0030F5844A